MSDPVEDGFAEGFRGKSAAPSKDAELHAAMDKMAEKHDTIRVHGHEMAEAGDVKTFGDNQEYESLGSDEKAKNSEWDNITRDRDGKIEYWKKKAERPMA